MCFLIPGEHYQHPLEKKKQEQFKDMGSEEAAAEI